MPKCPFCDHRNPPSAAICEKCKAPLTPAGQIGERTDAEPQEGSDAVDALQRGEPLPSLPQIDDDLEKELLPLLQAGKKIQAVKAYRQHTDSNLKDAVRVIDALAAQHGLASKGGGCAGASVLLLVAVWAVVLFVFHVWR